MPESARTRVAEILLIEDNRLNVVGTGRDALQFLRREGEYAEVPRPDLMLLDLKLPDIHGLEVLAAVKSDSGLRRIPVVVFSSSQDRKEVLEAYNLNANSFITKPVNLPDFIRVVRGVEEFWLTVVKLPKE